MMQRSQTTISLGSAAAAVLICSTSTRLPSSPNLSCRKSHPRPKNPHHAALLSKSHASALRGRATHPGKRTSHEADAPHWNPRKAKPGCKAHARLLLQHRILKRTKKCKKICARDLVHKILDDKLSNSTMKLPHKQRPTWAIYTSSTDLDVLVQALLFGPKEVTYTVRLKPCSSSVESLCPFKQGCHLAGLEQA